MTNINVQPPKPNNKGNSDLVEICKVVFKPETGLIALILLSVGAALFITIKMPDTPNENKDARNGFLNIISVVITGCFALLQTNGNQQSKESKEGMQNLESQLVTLQQQIVEKPVSTNNTEVNTAAEDNTQIGNYQSTI